jgi:hypothetical protein
VLDDLVVSSETGDGLIGLTAGTDGPAKGKGGVLSVVHTIVINVA